ncbi:MAG: hypothetical protein IK066_05265, partial [Kiritimatiellae bacterium]|nr:hypothetical protein [Kiritimatiellia bacterium]
ILKATRAEGTFDATTQTLSFDILPLLSSPEASAALAANGALVRLDYDTNSLPDSDSFAMLNLYNTQAGPANRPSASWRLASVPVAASDESAGVARIYYIDQNTPDATEWNDSVRFIVNANPEKGDTRVLLALPDLDLPTVESLGTLHVDADLNWRDNPEIPAFANVLTVPFGATEATCASWNRADHTAPETAWDGGAFSDALSFPAVFTGTNSVDFDLSALLASDLRGDAFANGLLVQWDVSRREAVTNSHVKHILYRKPAPTLSWTQRPVSYSYIDAGKNADVNFGWTGANHDKCIVVLNSGTGESRTLVKFAPSFFDFDPAQNPSLILSFPYWKEWPGEEDPNEIALQPLASPFRMDQATWNSAAAATPWATPGGDLDESVSVPGTVDRDAQVITFDMTPLFGNPDALAELLENGAALRILGEHPVEKGSVGFNFFGTTGPVALVLAADGVEFRSISFDYPATAEADPESAARDASAEGPLCTLVLTGLDPTLDYAVYSCTDLVEGDWSTFVAPVPDDGRVTFRPTGSAASYRVELRK